MGMACQFGGAAPLLGIFALCYQPTDARERPAQDITCLLVGRRIMAPVVAAGGKGAFV